MRQGLVIAVVVIFSSCAVGQSASSQTARQALIEMFFGQAADHFDKHLPDITRRSLSKLSSPDGQNILAEVSMLASQIRASGADFQTFDTGPTLLIAQDPRAAGNGPDKVEITVERDDLIGEQDEIELGIHLTKNGQEHALPVVPRFTFTMQQEANVWRLNEIAVTVRVPLADPAFLKTMEDQQRSRNEQMAMWAIQQVNTAEKSYTAAHGNYACSLPALAAAAQKQKPPAVYFFDPELAKGTKAGYVFAISGCDPSHYKIVAEPAVADAGERAFCSDEGGSVRASADGKATTCLASGEALQGAEAERATGLAVVMAPAVAAGSGAQTSAKAHPAQPSSPAQKPVVRVRVSAGVSQAFLISKVEPHYPQEAKTAGAQGPVVLAAVIGQDGSVQSLRVINSASPLLNQAAIDAVQQWKYKPYMLNGTPVEVDTTIAVNFTLRK